MKKRGRLESTADLVPAPSSRWRRSPIPKLQVTHLSELAVVLGARLQRLSDVGKVRLKPVGASAHKRILRQRKLSPIIHSPHGILYLLEYVPLRAFCTSQCQLAMAAIIRRKLWHAHQSPFSLAAAPQAGRFFSTSVRRDVNYGFIGLGAMGYPMAANLRSKIEADDHVIVHDVNKQSLDNFKSEYSSGVSVADSSADAAKNSVCTQAES